MAIGIGQRLHGLGQGVLVPLFGNDEKPPLFLKFRSNKSFILVACCFVIFVDIYQYGSVLPWLAMPFEEKASMLTYSE